ncbi:MAG: hypothetical protein M5U34_41265 [Chloroflexi bacterium]|nr:hypothetical protein [Chloroflexota bacterium]
MGGVLILGLLEGLVLATFLGLIVLLFSTKRRNTIVVGKVAEYRSVSQSG